MYKFFILQWVFLFISLFTSADNVRHIYHYTTENGLPQYTIMDMFQGKKGFMWFATWDGISKFDGYSFYNYKIQPGDNYSMKSNRIEKFAQDRYERIWMISYEGDLHCFNPATESFWGFQLVPELKDFNFFTSDIQVLPSGRVWIMSEKNGCVLISDSLFHVQRFNKSLKSIRSNFVRKVFEDKNNNSWILTDDGLYNLPLNETNLITYNFHSSMSNQSFYSACESKADIWFGSSNGKLWQYHVQNKTFDPVQLKFNSEIIDIAEISPNQLILLSASSGFAILNTDNMDVSYFDSANQRDLKTNNMKSVKVDIAGRIWIETSEFGICKFNLSNKSLRHYFIPSGEISTSVFPPKFILLNDKLGNTWIQPKGGGLTLYNPATDELEPFDTSVGSEIKLSNTLRSACTDKQGNLWLCTRSQGLEKVSFDKNYFKIKPINGSLANTLSNNVRMVYQDKDKNLWVSTKDQKVTIFDAAGKIIGRLSRDGSIKTDAYFSSAIYAMLQDGEGNIWLGTKNDGLFKLKKEKGKKAYSIDQFKLNKKDFYSISENSIYSIYQDKNANIWVGTYGGGLNLIEQMPDGKTKFINSRNELKKYPSEIAQKVRFITQDNHDHICVGTTEGLIVFPMSFSSTESLSFKTYSRIPGNEQSLSNNDVHNIFVTQNNEMYIATFGGGLNKVQSWDKEGYPLTFRQFNTKNGLPSDVTLSIQEDNKGMLWISTEKNLTRLDPTNYTFETFTEINRLMNTATFSESSTFKTTNGELLFGFSSGIISFNPAEIIHDDYKPYVSLSGFQLFNKNVKIGKDSPLNSSIDYANNLTLTHQQNFFTISFAALDMTDPNNILYAYKLEGFDDDWNYIQKQRVANYTNLPHGEYVLRIKSTNSEGLWIDNERSLPVKILPSFWETPIAYILYVVVSLGLISLVFYILLTIYHLKANVKFEKQMSELKLRFFTDISHEIRTPLTMITAPVDFLVNDINTPETIRKQLKMISQNTGRMLRLVNQIMDFRKIQFLHLKVQETEIAPFVGKICDNFKEYAVNQRIKFKFINQVGTERIWFDQDCMEKIVMNLLSNAFKFTPNGRAISVVLKSVDKYITLEVHDQGPGLTKEKQKKLFTRFASFNEDKSKPSTGIGLSMVKDLAEKHAAKVTVESEVGKGSCFKVSFLKGVSHFNKSVEIIAASAVEMSTEDEKSDPTNNTEILQISIEKTNEASKPSVLITEDDAELRSFMRSIIENDYIIYEAGNGVEGLEIAIKQSPDIIISDIMMPEMDGIEFLRELKNEILTSHIPVVLLTAKTTIESKLEGLTYGADDYITKPFSVPYFQARIVNLLQQRIKLQEYYRTISTEQNMSGYNPQPIIITSQDEDLMKKVMDIIEENMENSDFMVENLGQQVGMSRSAFFKKLKGLTGLAPVEFIRDIKMKRAAQILVSSEFIIKEVAFMVGMNDSKYFSKCFKDKFGMTPMEYKKSKRAENQVDSN